MEKCAFSMLVKEKNAKPVKQEKQAKRSVTITFKDGEENLPLKKEL